MKIQRVQQISESHCGPAVLEMLLKAIGIEVSQGRIVAALGIEHLIDEHGVSPSQLGVACNILAPETNFWYKYYANMNDVAYVLNRGFAVGVEWQGLFYNTEEEELNDMTDESDFGHYSVISHYDESEQLIVIVDPYKDFVDQNRIFDVPVFLRRWWDTNEIVDQVTGRYQIVRDEQFMFFITPKEEKFDHDFGFRLFSRN